VKRILPVCVVALLAAGCASKLPRAPESLSIDAPARVPSPARDRVIAVRTVDVTPLYAGSFLVYRVGEHALERDRYASLAASPGSMLTAAIRGYVAGADFVRDVVAPGEGLVADAVVQPSAVELFGDFGNSEQPTAALTLQFRVLLPASPARAMLLKTYSRRVPLSQRTAKAVVVAWNKGLAEIMAEFLKDLEEILPRS